MGHLVKEQIKRIIEQTNDVFENSGGVNTDYADFATIALSDFKAILGNPDLTDRELKQLIRRASKRHRDEKLLQKTSASWSSFTAHYISRRANVNKPIINVMPIEASTDAV